MIDVLLSVRNCEKFICESVAGVLGQTYKDFALYIIDDASIDNTINIIKSFNDKRIRLFQNKISQGLTKNLNFLLRKSSGEFVARQDADDVSRSDRFEKQMLFLQKNNLGLVGSDANLVNIKGEVVGERTYKEKNIKQDLIKFNMFLHSSWFVKREVFEKLNGYDEKFKYAQDYDFLLRAISKYKLGICPDELINLRWDDNSLSLKHLKEQQKFALMARLNAISRGDYSRTNYIYLFKPLISYLTPAVINKFIYGFLR